ncbi:MAG: TlpA disulfide reductase family protein [Bryobacteraceae bacterium]
MLKQGRRSALARRQKGLYVLAGVALAGTLLAFPVTRVMANRCVDACVAGTNAVGQALGITAAFQSERGSELKTLEVAPGFRLKDRHGNPVELADFRGKVVVLNFWATWCGPCKVEIPWFMEFQQRFRESGLTVLGVSMDEDGWKSVGPYLDEHKVNYPVMIGDDELAKAYGGLDALPMTFLINKSGRIAVVHTGLVAKATYEGEIKKLMAE